MTAQEKIAQLEAALKAARAEAKVHRARTWVLFQATPRGFEEVGRSADHNSLEAKAAPINRKAKTRVAFVIDASFVPAMPKAKVA